MGAASLAAQGRPVYETGEWEVDLARRELRVRGVPLPLGDRAFDIIEILVQAAGDIVPKDVLMTRVWPDAIVEENTLQVHISALRKVLGPSRTMLKTVPGRGYRLLGDWTSRGAGATPDAAAVDPRDMPPQPSLATARHLIGREGAVQRLRELLSTCRMVTLTGPGGIGKTVLALEVARTLLPAFQGEVWPVELAAVSDPDLVPSACARPRRFSALFRLSRRPSDAGRNGLDRTGRGFREGVQRCCQGIHRRVGLVAQLVALRKPSRIIVRQPGVAAGILPDQHLQRQIDPDGLDRLHKRRASPGIAEDEKIGRTQRHFDRRGSRRVIDACKRREAFCPDFALEPVHRFFRPVAASCRHQPVCNHRFLSSKVRAQPPLRYPPHSRVMFCRS